MTSDVVHHALRTDLVLGFDIVKDLQINEENLALMICVHAAVVGTIAFGYSVVR